MDSSSWVTGKAGTPDPATGQLRDVVERVPFLSLGLDLPPAPLYKDVMEKNIIPQASRLDMRRQPQPRAADRSKQAEWVTYLRPHP